MPDLIRHPDVVPTKVGNHLKGWLPVFTGNTGFRLEFIPMKIGAGMTPVYKNLSKTTSTKNCRCSKRNKMVVTVGQATPPAEQVGGVADPTKKLPRRGHFFRAKSRKRPRTLVYGQTLKNAALFPSEWEGGLPAISREAERKIDADRFAGSVRNH